MGSPQYIAALKDIAGGSKNMQGWLDLTGQHLQQFQDNVNNVSGTVKKGGNAIVGWSDVQKTFNFQMDQARAAVEVLMIKIGTALLPVVGQLVGAITPLITQFTNWVTSAHGVSDFLTSMAPNMLAVKAGLLALGGVIGGIVVAALWSMAAAAGAALLPLLPFIGIGAAIGLVIAGLVIVWEKWNVQLKSVFMPIILWVGTFFNTIFLPAIKLIGAFLISTFYPVWLQLVSLWKTQLLPSLISIWNSLKPLQPLLQFIGICGRIPTSDRLRTTSRCTSRHR